MNLTYRHFSVFLFKKIYALFPHTFLLNASCVPVPTIDCWCLSDKCESLCRADEQTVTHLLLLLQSCLQTQGQELKLSTWTLRATIKYNFIPCSIRNPNLTLDPIHMPATTTHSFWELEDTKHLQSPGFLYPGVRKRSHFDVDFPDWQMRV